MTWLLVSWKTALQTLPRFDPLDPGFRARREAVIRMKEDARRQGGNIVLNVKLDSTRIHAGGRNATVSVEASAYGTSYRRGSAGVEIH